MKILPMISVSHGNSCAGNPHMRFPAGKVSPLATPRRRSLFHVETLSDTALHIAIVAVIAFSFALSGAPFSVRIIAPEDVVGEDGVVCVENMVIRRTFARPDELPQIRRNLEQARKAAGGQDIWSVLPAYSDGRTSMREPKFEELRAMTYLSIACGAKGVVYRTSDKGRRIVEAIQSELAVHGGELVSEDAPSQPQVLFRSGAKTDVFGGPGIACRLTVNGLMIAVNMTVQDVDIRYTLPSGETFDNRLLRNGTLVHRADPPRRRPKTIPAVTPRQWDGGVDSAQYSRHLEIVAKAKKGGAKIVFVGDGDVAGWDLPNIGIGYDGVWRGGGDLHRRRHFCDGDFAMLNLGVEGDCTENILWRLDHGELDGYEAKVVVVMAGGENTRRRSQAEEPVVDTILGIRAILDKIHAKQPNAKIVLHPILPTGKDPSCANRTRNAKINHVIQRYADDKIVWWCDFSDQLLTADGRVLSGVMPDYQHPAEYGYQIWASALVPYVYAEIEGRRLPPSRYSAHIDPRAFSDGESRATYPASRIAEKMVSFESSARKPEWWSSRLLRNRNQIFAWDGAVDVAFVGDSITENWEGPGRKQWEALSRTFRMLNLGYGGDRTCEAIWRLENGELDGYKAKLFVVMIGTNNHGLDLEADAAAGVRRILELIAEKQPQARTLLLPIFPRDEHVRCACRAKNEIINAQLRPLVDGEKVIWVDFSERFFDADGDVKWLSKDRLHPGPKGYDFWVEAITPYLEKYAR